MTPESPTVARLKHTSVSHPLLQHSPSQQSITASEITFSLSDHNNNVSESDDHSRITAFRFAKSPSLHHSSVRSDEHVASEAPATSSLKLPRETPSLDPRPKYLRVVSFDEASIAPKQSPRYLTAASPASRRAMDSTSPATTPGMDDTPYIRFAIDQLTRDEEVRGSRHYPGIFFDNAESEDSYTVERTIPSEEPGYMSPRPPPPAVAAPLARRDPARDSLRQSLREPARESLRQSLHEPARESLRQSLRDNAPVQEPIQEPLRGPLRDSLRGTVPPALAEVREVLVPHRPTHDSLTSPPLEFMPFMLKPLGLIIFVFICALVLAGLIFSAVWSHKHQGLWSYTGFGGGRYFVFEYLPIMIGMFILMWLFQVQTALQRIGPFIALHSDSGRARAGGVFLDLFPTHFFLPNFQYFSMGYAGLGVCSIIFWLFQWTIPLLASCYNVRYYGTADDGEWRWVAVEPIVWTIVALYALAIVAVVTIIVSVSRRETGLKWDPRSLADIVCLIERSNAMKDYEGSETFRTKQEFRERLSNRSDRLGYWHTTRRTTDVFYSLGEPGGATRHYSIVQGRIKEKGADEMPKRPKDSPPETKPGDFVIRMDIRSSKVRLRYLPWLLSDSAVIAWVVIAIVLVLAFLIVSFVRHAIKNGFFPQVSAHTNDLGFSCSNFLYSFVPCFIGMVLFLFWQSIDLNLRALQPFASLSAPGGATAEHSLLLDYTARLPVSVTVIAASNGHYRVAFASFLTLVNAVLPILGGGAFWTQFYAGTSTIRVAADLPGYYALCVFLVIYAVSTLVIIPGRRRMALPHRARNLAELISFLYQSPLTTDRAFSRPTTKADLVTRLMGAGWTDRSTFSRSLTNLLSPSKRNLIPGDMTPTEKFPTTTLSSGLLEPQDGVYKRMSVVDPGSVRYGFGVYYGRDGQEHLGIDRVRRGVGRELVIHEAQRRSWISRV